MLLIVTNTLDPTADYVEQRIVEQGLDYRRLNSDKLLLDGYNFELSASGWELSLNGQGQPYQLGEITSVWYRRPIEPKLPAAIVDQQHKVIVATEADALLKNVYALMADANWVDKPSNIRQAGNKLRQLEVARRLGLTVPDTIVTTDANKAERFVLNHAGQVVMKSFMPIFYTAEDGEKFPGYTTRLSNDMIPELANLGLCPTILQEEIPKQHELRVTVIGTKVFAAKVCTVGVEGKELDWRAPSAENPHWEKCSIPQWLEQKCMEIVDYYGLQYGAFDFAYTPDGEYVFFEVNANGQWVWIEIETGMPMTQALLETLGCL